MKNKYKPMLNRNKNLEIIKDESGIKLRYTHKLQKLQKTMKNKGKTINTFYTSYLPAEIIQYLGLTEPCIYFSEVEGEVYITRREPVYTDSKMIKIQKTNNFSIPRSIFKEVDGFKVVVLTLNLSNDSLTIHLE